MKYFICVQKYLNQPSKVVVVDPYINSAVNDSKIFWLHAGLSMLNGRLKAERPPVLAGPGYLRVRDIGTFVPLV